MATKIITCTYCGNQELIRLAEGERFRLVCSACGAAKKDVEIVQPLKQQPVQPPMQPASSPQQASIQPAMPQPEGREKKQRNKDRKDYKEKKSRKRKYEKSGKRKKRKSTVKYWFEKVKDEIEDIFD